MKKLMFATALAASAAAFADGPLNAISFEGYSADATVGNTADTPDASGGDNGMYFYFDGDGDGSLVKAFGSGDVAAPSITRPLFFASASPNANYLELSTEGGTLWRSINTLESDTSGETPTYDLGEAKPVAATGTYFDSLVQFTPTEDGGAPELDAADKLAIWLNVDANSVTNLMVKAGSYNDAGTPIVGGATFVLSGKTIDPGTWYRLTVKAVDDILPANESFKIPGFQVFIDSVPMVATTSPISATFVGALREAEMITAEQETAINSGAYLPSLVAGTPGAASTLQGVGFKGSGALDDIVWTEEDPFAGGAGGDDYKVVIGGNDVVVTPTQADLEAIGQALPGLNVNDPTAVNAVLATPIEGSDGIPAWQALFLGLEPTTNALEAVKIDSVTLENGKVSIVMADGLTLKTNRGVSILFKVFASDDLTTWGNSPIVTATDTTEIPEITPAFGETKKFYKVKVDFAPPPPQN